MKIRTYIKVLLSISLILAIASCDEIQKYPIEPVIEYKSFNLYSTTDLLGNTILLGKLEIDFTDGDGDIGLLQPDSSAVVDSLKFNLMMTMFAMQQGEFVEIDDENSLQNFRIPYIERTGQNKTLSGTIIVDIEYKTIQYDTIYYTFYILDRSFHRSNVDTTDVLVFTGINL
jgi:hypothetical protein